MDKIKDLNKRVDLIKRFVTATKNLNDQVSCVRGYFNNGLLSLDNIEFRPLLNAVHDNLCMYYFSEYEDNAEWCDDFEDKRELYIQEHIKTISSKHLMAIFEYMNKIMASFNAHSSIFNAILAANYDMRHKYEHDELFSIAVCIVFNMDYGDCV